MNVSPDNSEPERSQKRASGRLGRIVLALLFLVTAGFGVVHGDFSLIDSESSDVPPTSTVVADLLSAQTSDVALSAADVAELANPGVVTIYNLQSPQPQDTLPGSENDDEGSGEPQAVGTGSGWIYSADGYVVTNAHVVEGAESVVVQFMDGSTADADVIGIDPVQDVAVVQLNLEEDQEIPGVLTVGDSTVLRPGDEVVAIGSPLGQYANSVTTGTIGGLNRSLATDVNGSLDNLLQHNADISSGNSGGPLLNMQGEFIGMNVAKIDTTGQQNVSVSGLYFAIDGNTVVDRVEQLIAEGEVVYPYLGVETQTTLDGIQVMGVIPDGPADQAGVEAGDLIIAIGDDEVTPTTSLTQLLFQYRAGETIDISVNREGDTVTMSVTLGERPESLS